MIASPEAVIARLDARTRYDRGCLVWQGRGNNGYGQTSIAGQREYAHRLACELEHGPAPADKPFACHTCDNRACARPDHLYWGDHSDNLRDWRDRQWAPKAACPRGHAYDETNTYVYPNGNYYCRACNRAAKRRTQEEQ